MDRDRGFTEVSVLPCCVQPYTERFHSESDDLRPPGVMLWRCNLTALSHCFNLYFVAVIDKIRIYEPTFPEQKLSHTPSLIIDLPTSGRGVQGDIDAENSHAVNNLLVDFLGSEEILLVACDDGDVIGYKTHVIQRELEARMDPGYEGVLPRAFFVENVGRSAWGLAVHHEARMIGVSANTHQVMIFAFALVDEGSSEADSSTLNANSEGNTPKGFPSVRSTSHCILLDDTGSNIPEISFCNTGEDPTGRWLLSGDIEGEVHLWDIHRPYQCELRNTAFCFKQDGLCACPGRREYIHGMWGVFWVDRRAFRNAKSLETAAGSKRTFNHKSALQGGILDITHSREEVRNASMVYRNSSAVELQSSQSQPSLEVDAEADVEEGFLFDTDEEESTESEDSDSESTAEPQSAEDALETPTLLVGILLTGQDGVIDESQIHFVQRKRHPKPNVRFEDLATDMHWRRNLPDSPILQISARDVFMLDPASYTGNIVAFHEPLYQTWPYGFGLDAYDRMSFLAQIPELGVFIAGSPKGRVAIFSLTQYSDPKDSSCSKKYAFRLDHILPFRDQEHRDQRPERQVLIGIAVAPIQGMYGQHSDTPRRWRLILTFHKHTILSYEIGKFRKDSTGVQALVI